MGTDGLSTGGRFSPGWMDDLQASKQKPSLLGGQGRAGQVQASIAGAVLVSIEVRAEGGNDDVARSANPQPALFFLSWGKVVGGMVICGLIMKSRGLF